MKRILFAIAVVMMFAVGVYADGSSNPCGNGGVQCGPRYCCKP